MAGRRDGVQAAAGGSSAGVGGGGGIFLVQGAELVELRAAAYDSESVLQALIARFPNLLAGDQPAGVSPRRWLLIARETGLPDQEHGGSRWAVDHLFLDQEAVPTLVEVKRASDTRIRREVVGQLLDYAANAAVYWPIERLRELFLRECERSDRDPDEAVLEVAGPELGVEGFWQRAEENLRAGRLRLVFVADEIPRELKRVIEFLNGQMHAEVLGVQVRQHVGEGVTALVPSLVGQTAEADTRKRRGATRPSRTWDAESFFAALREQCKPAQVALAQHLYDWTGEHGWTHTFGSGADNGSWRPVLTVNGIDYPAFSIRTNGVLIVRFRALAARPPFDKPAARQQLLEQLNTIPTVRLGPDKIDRNPRIPLADLTTDQASKTIERLLQAIQVAVSSLGVDAQPSD